MNDELRLKILNYWIEKHRVNVNRNTGMGIEELLMWLDDIILFDDANDLIEEIHPKNAKVTISELIDYRDKILDKVHKEAEIGLINIEKSTILLNKMLVVATIAMAFAAILNLYYAHISINIATNQLEFQYEQEKPRIGYIVSPCMPIMIDSSNKGKLQSHFIVSNGGKGNIPLPLEFEIKSDYAEFKFTSSSMCYDYYQHPCCVEFYNNCTYSGRNEYKEAIQSGGKKKIDYEIFVYGGSRYFDYNIIVKNPITNESIEILSCKYIYETFEDLGHPEMYGYRPYV